MRFFAALLAIAMLPAAVDAQPRASGGARRASHAVTVDVVAVHAFSEGRGARVYDRHLDELRDTLSDLDYDTFLRLSTKPLRANLNEEATYKINSRYTLCVKPLSREPSGQVRLNVRVEMSGRDRDRKPVNAISTTLLISPDKKLKLRGLKLDRGELVLVLTLRG